MRVVTPGGESPAVTSDLFTYGPTITSLSRTSGPVAGGTKVTITGKGFTTVHNVKFGTTTARSYTVRSATQIVATSPAHAAGQVRISVTTAGGDDAGHQQRPVHIPLAPRDQRPSRRRHVRRREGRPGSVVLGAVAGLATFGRAPTQVAELYTRKRIPRQASTSGPFVALWDPSGVR